MGALCGRPAVKAVEAGQCSRTGGAEALCVSEEGKEHSGPALVARPLVAAAQRKHDMVAFLLQQVG
jgi:hypothetical protein